MLIFDMEMYDTSSNPFETLNMDYIHYSNKGLELGSKFRRYSLDLESGKATYLDILEREKDLVGFPIINPSWQGR
jgi:hypothetical protein